MSVLTWIVVPKAAGWLPEPVVTRGEPRIRPVTGSNFEETRSSGASNQLAVPVYPAQLEEWIEFQGQPAMLRPIRPDDLAQHQRFLVSVTREDMRMRFFTAIRELPPRDLERLTKLDYDRDMAFIAVSERGGREETLGVARACANPDNSEAEIAVLVRSDLKGLGLGALLLKKLTRYCSGRGINRLTGQALAQNTRMLQLARKLGFSLQPSGYDLVEMTLTLNRHTLRQACV
jgi:GNAT superfamily N-acetyltransferase